MNILDLLAVFLMKVMYWLITCYHGLFFSYCLVTFKAAVEYMKNTSFDEMERQPRLKREVNIHVKWKLQITVQKYWSYMSDYQVWIFIHLENVFRNKQNNIYHLFLGYIYMYLMYILENVSICFI